MGYYLNLIRKIVSKHNQGSLTRKYLQIGNSINRGINIRIDVPIESRKLVIVGDKSVIGGNFVFESEKGVINIGDNVFMGGCTLICRSNITIGNYVQIAWGVYLYDHNAHSTDFRLRRNDIEDEFQSLVKGKSDTAGKNWDIVKSSPIIIEDDVWIGMNAVILKGVTVGHGSVIGAGSVVRQSVPPFSVVMGNPARVVRFLYKPEEIMDIQKTYYTHLKTITKDEYEAMIKKYYNREV